MKGKVAVILTLLSALSAARAQYVGPSRTSKQTPRGRMYAKGAFGSVGVGETLRLHTQTQRKKNKRLRRAA